MVAEAVQVYIAPDEASDGQPRLVAQLLLDDRQHLIDEPAERIEVRRVHRGHCPDEQQTGTLAPASWRQGNQPQMSQNLYAGQAERFDLLGLPRTDCHYGLAEIRVPQFLLDGSVHVE